jgi:polysaccharide biosynthesis transport protein
LSEWRSAQSAQGAQGAESKHLVKKCNETCIYSSLYIGLAVNNPEINDAPANDSIDLRQYAFLLWHWAWLIALAAVLAAGSAYLFSKGQTPIYQASTTIMVNSAPSTQSTDYSSIMASQNLTATYAQMITNQPVLKAVAQRLELGDDTKALGSISVTPVRDTQLITIAVELPDADLAAKVANGIAEVFAGQIQDMQSARYDASSETIKVQMASMDTQIQDLTAQAAQASDKTEQARLEDKLAQYRDIYARLLLSYEDVRLTEAQTISSITPVDPAAVPLEPVRPKTAQNTLLAGVVGALLATGLIFLIDTLDDTIRDPEALLKKYNLPVLGVIAHHEQIDGQPVVQRSPRSPVSEAFRSLRTNVKYASVDRPVRTLLVTSPTPSDGKSTITTNLAVVLAQGGSRVFVLDADLRRPVIHRLLGTNNRIGLTSLFVQAAVHLNGSVQHIQKTENISVISSGALPPNPAELLGSRKMGEILDFILKQCDIVLLDTPPVLSVTDAVVLAPAVDGVLLVIKPGATKQAAFKQAITQLNQVGANLLGVVVNEVGASGGYTNYYYRRYYQDHYGYRDAYAETEPVKHKPKVFRLFSKRGKHVEREPAVKSAPAENQ